MRARCEQYESQFIAAGVHGLPTSASPATISEPPGTGVSAGVVGGVVVAAAAVVAVAPVVAVTSLPVDGVDPAAMVVAPAAVVVAAPAVVAGACVSPLLSSFLLHAAASSPRLISAAAATRPVRPERCGLRICVVPP
ncbi:MAG: hypothetical protein ABIR68_12640 [Ilumatobacteraceae bacterium]